MTILINHSDCNDDDDDGDDLRPDLSIRFNNDHFRLQKTILKSSLVQVLLYQVNVNIVLNFFWFLARFIESIPQR